jgi:hypothetical protein
MEVKPDTAGPIKTEIEQHATLQSVFLHEKQIPTEFGWVGEEADECSLYRDITDFVIFHKSKGQVTLEAMHDYAPCFIKGENEAVQTTFFFCVFVAFCALSEQLSDRSGA